MNTTDTPMKFETDHQFDTKTKRHMVNGATSVLHCHHYATLYAQLADDAALFDGKGLLRQAAELAFYDVLRGAFERQNAKKLEDRISIAESYWKYTGLGRVKFDRLGPMAASAHMDRSHVDEGWIQKWDRRDEPVNFVGQGFLAASLAAVYDLPVGSYLVQETQSMVSGAETSQFSIARKS